MAKFIYRMQNVLEIKYKLEDQAKADYIKAKKEFDVQSDKLKELIKIKEDYEKRLQDCMQSKLDIMKIRELKSGVDISSERIEEQKLQVIKAYKRLNAAKDKLNQLMIERKTHEKLRDNEFEQFVKEVNSQEMKEVDELVSFRFNIKEMK